MVFKRKRKKTPKNEIDKALKLMRKYYQEKNKIITETKNWAAIKNDVYGEKGTERLRNLKENFKVLKLAYS